MSSALERGAPQLQYGRAFFRPTVFIGGSSDVRAEISQIYSAVADIAAHRYPELRPYHWSDERYVDRGTDWQDNIRRPADPNVELGVFTFRGRVGVLLPNIEQHIHSDRFAPLREFIAVRKLPIAFNAGDPGVPLTGTVFELLEVLRAREHGEGKPHLLVYRFEPPVPQTEEEREQRRWLEILFEEVWPSRASWPQPTFVDGPLLAQVRDDASGLLFGTSLSEFDLAFPGLSPYGAASAGCFFGRAEESADIRQKLLASRSDARSLLILHGPSGSGKSSLARAGVGGSWARHVGSDDDHVGLVAEFVVPDDEDALDRHSIRTFAEAIGAASGFKALSVLAESWPEGVGPEQAAEQTQALFRSQTKDVVLLLVVDQAERLLVTMRADGSLPRDPVSKQFAALRANWTPILQYLDLCTRGSAGSRKPCVLMTIADDLPEGGSDAKSFRARLTGSKVYQRIESEGGPIEQRLVTSFGPAQARSAARLSFREAQLPELSQDILESLERSFEHANRAALPLFAIILRRIAVQALERVRAQPRLRDQPLRMSDVRVPSMADVVEEQGEEAYRRFLSRTAGIETEEEQDAAPRVLANVLRKLVKAVLDGGRAEKSRDYYTVSASFSEDDEHHLAECLVETRLALRVGRDRFRLAHAVVVEAWPRAAQWLLDEYDLSSVRAMLEREHELREKRSVTLGRDLALRAIKTLDYWREDASAFSVADRVLLDTDMATHVSNLSVHERFDIFLRALRSDCPKTLAACRTIPQGVARADWIHVNPRPNRDRTASTSPSPLVLAARAKSRETLRWLLSAGANPLFKDWNGWSVAHELARSRDAAMLEELITSVPVPLRPKLLALEAGDAMLTPLHAAVIEPCTRDEDDAAAAKVVALLIEAGAPVRHQTRFKRTALHYAAFNNYPRCADVLVRSDPRSLFVTNDRGQIPLHFAALNGHVAVLQAIRRVLGQKGQSQISEMVRRKDGAPNFPTGRTALQTAALHGRADVVRMLLDWGSPTNVSDDQERSVAIAGVIGGNERVVQSLAAKLPDNVFQARDNRRRNVLHYAVKGGAHELLPHILPKLREADLNAVNDEGHTPLLLAVRLASLQNRDRDRILACARRLVARGADVSIADHDDRTPMLWASGSGARDIIDLIAERRPEAVSEPSKIGRTPLHDAAQYGRPDTVRRLLKLGASLTASGSHGNTPLHTAAFTGRADTLSAMIMTAPARARAALLEVENDYEETPLHSAVDGGSLPCVELLARLRANPNAIDKRGRTPVTRAMRFGRIDMVRALLELAGAAPAHALHAAVNMQSAELVEILLAAGANADEIAPPWGETALFEAIRKDNTQIANLLIERMSAEALRVAETRNNATVLHQLTWKSLHFNTINRGVILARIADRILEHADTRSDRDALINPVDAKGRTPLRNATNARLDAAAAVLSARGATSMGERGVHPIGARGRRHILDVVSNACYVALAAMILALLHH